MNVVELIDALASKGLTLVSCHLTGSSGTVSGFRCERFDNSPPAARPAEREEDPPPDPNAALESFLGRKGLADGKRDE
jgi:hypothetical protein